MNKVLVIGRNLSRNAVGGMEALTADVARILDNNNYQVTFCGPKLTQAELIIENSRYITFDCTSSRYTMKFWLSIIKNKNKMRDFDTIYSAGNAAFPLVFFASRHKVILHCHQTAYRNAINNLKRGDGLRFIINLSRIPREILAFRIFRTILSVSLNVQKDINRFPYYSKSTLLTNFVPETVFQFSKKDREEVRLELGINELEKVYISTSRLEKNKEILSTLQLWVKKNNFNSKLLIIGEGSLRNTVVSLTEKDSRVLYLGRKNRSQLGRYLSASDFYISGSKNEGLSLSILEALANGLNVLVSPEVRYDLKANHIPAQYVISLDDIDFLEIERLGRSETSLLPEHLGFNFYENSLLMIFEGHT